MNSAHRQLNSARTVSAAWGDWWSGTRNAELWWTLAWYDVVLRYRRSMLGPLWMTISMGLMLLGMGPLYSSLFKVPLGQFFPHLALGIIFWNFFTTTINDGCSVFIAAAPYLKQAEFSGSVFVWRSLARNLIALAHHADHQVAVGGVEGRDDKLAAIRRDAGVGPCAKITDRQRRLGNTGVLTNGGLAGVAVAGAV